MITYGIELTLKRSVGTVTTTNHVAVPAGKDGGLETRDLKEAKAALAHWVQTFPQHDFELIKVDRTVMETWLSTESAQIGEAVKRLKGVLMRLGGVSGRLNEARMAPTEASAAVDEALDDLRNTIDFIERSK